MISYTILQVIQWFEVFRPMLLLLDSIESLQITSGCLCTNFMQSQCHIISFICLCDSIPLLYQILGLAHAIVYIVGDT